MPTSSWDRDNIPRGSRVHDHMEYYIYFETLLGYSSLQFMPVFALITLKMCLAPVVARRPVPRRGFRGEFCQPTVLRRLCRHQIGR